MHSLSLNYRFLMLCFERGELLSRSVYLLQNVDPRTSLVPVVAEQQTITLVLQVVDQQAVTVSEGGWLVASLVGMEGPTRNAIWPVLLLLFSQLVIVQGLVGVDEVDKTCQSHETCMSNCAIFKVIASFEFLDAIASSRSYPCRQ